MYNNHKQKFLVFMTATILFLSSTSSIGFPLSRASPGPLSLSRAPPPLCPRRPRPRNSPGRASRWPGHRSLSPSHPPPRPCWAARSTASTAPASASSISLSSGTTLNYFSNAAPASITGSTVSLIIVSTLSPIFTVVMVTDKLLFIALCH